MIILHGISDTNNTIPSNNIIPTPDGMKAIDELEENNIEYIYGSDGIPTKYKNITLLDEFYDVYEVSFKNRMNIITSGTQQFPIFSLLDFDIKRMSVDKMMKEGPISADGTYKFNIPTSPVLKNFDNSVTGRSVSDRKDYINKKFNYNEDTGYSELIINSKEELYRIGLIVQSLGYGFNVIPKGKSYICTIDVNILNNKVATISGIRKLDVKSKMIGIKVDNKDNMFIGPNMAIMCGYNI